MSGISRTLIAISLILGTTSALAQRSEPFKIETDEFELHANRLTLEPEVEQLVASGRVRLIAGSLEFDASSLVLDLKAKTLQLLDPTVTGYENASIHGTELSFSLNGKSLTIEEPRFTLIREPGLNLSMSASSAVCVDRVCELQNAVATACPHEPSGYKVRAKSVVLHPNGDTDLTAPVVTVDEKAVFALPWIRLRHPDSAGFLPPHLGYSETAGFIFGPAGYIPIGKEASMEGHFAARTASGFEASASVETPSTDLRVDHLAESKGNEVRVQTGSQFTLEQARLSWDMDLLTNRRIIDETTFSPLERSKSHTVSQILASTGNDALLVETYFELLHAFDSTDYIAGNQFVPTASIEIALPAAPLLRFLWPEFSVTFTRRGAADQAAMIGANGQVVPGHSKLDITYGIGTPARIGPFEIVTLAALRHQAWLIDKEQYGTATHQSAILASLNLPLVKNFKLLAHTVQPFVRYRLAPWSIGSNPDWAMDDSDRLRLGQGLEAGFETRLIPKTRIPIARLEVWERFDLPGFGATAGPAYLAAAASVGNESLTVSVDGAWDHVLDGFSLGGISITAQNQRRTKMSTGARWIGPGLGPHSDQTFATATGPWLLSRDVQIDQGQVEIFEDLRFSLSRRLGALFGTRIGVWPKATIHTLNYGLEFGSPCGCVVLGLLASHRLGSQVPDIMAMLSMPAL